MSDTSSALELVNSSGQVIGLEDFSGSADFGVPVVQILHKEGVFEERLSGTKYEALKNVVLLGLIKQRVLWPAVMSDEKSPPLCRSYDGIHGNTGTDFPWAASALTQNDVTVPEERRDDAHFLANCDNCKLQEWGTHPIRDTPWCSTQHTYAIMLNEDGVLAPAVLTIQRSGLKASTHYCAGFQRAQKPLFTQFTDVTLELRSRGGTEYAVPKFVRAGATEPSDYDLFATNYFEIRDYLQTPRSFDEQEETPVAAPGPVGAPPAAAPVSSPPPAVAPGPPVASAPTPTPAPVVAPQAEPAPASEPFVPPPAQVAAPAPAAAATDLPF